MYQALIFPSLREAHASSYAGKIGNGEEAMVIQAKQGFYNHGLEGCDVTSEARVL